MAAITPLTNLYKASWSGELGTDEIFTYSRWVSADLAADQENIADQLTDSATNMLAQAVTLGPIATLAQGFPDWVAWTELKVAPWNPSTDHLVTGQTPAYRTLTDVGTGTGTSGLPFQTALAMTTRCAVSGRRKYNRFYLPPLQILATDGQGNLDPDVAAAFALWWDLDVTSHAALSPSLVFCNYVRSVPGPWLYPTIDLYLGHRIDTIRRRRNHAPEARTIDTL